MIDNNPLGNLLRGARYGFHPSTFFDAYVRIRQYNVGNRIWSIELIPPSEVQGLRSGPRNLEHLVWWERDNQIIERIKAPRTPVTRSQLYYFNDQGEIVTPKGV